MKVARYPIKISNKKTTLVLGGFEAFHLGHIALIEEAKKFKLPVTLMMIENPSNIPNKKVNEYCEFNTRLIQAANLGIEQVMVLTFTDEIRNKNGEEFLKELIDIYNVQNIVVGKDFAMGHNRSLSAEKIKEILSTTTIVEPIKFNNVKLSTSTLKEMVEVGDVHIIKKLSPFSYTITTRVNDDKTFTFSTTTPQRGVYAAFVIVDSIKFWALVKIGFESNTILIPDLHLVNSGFDARIEMRKLIRIIIRTDQGKVTDEDKEKTIDYLSENNF